MSLWSRGNECNTTLECSWTNECPSVHFLSLSFTFFAFHSYVFQLSGLYKYPFLLCLSNSWSTSFMLWIRPYFFCLKNPPSGSVDGIFQLSLIGNRSEDRWWFHSYTLQYVFAKSMPSYFLYPSSVVHFVKCTWFKVKLNRKDIHIPQLRLKGAFSSHRPFFAASASL